MPSVTRPITPSPHHSPTPSLPHPAASVHVNPNPSQPISNLTGDRPASAHSLRQLAGRSHYRRLGLVGWGQYGKVFLGIHRATGQLFALKELDPDRFPTHQFLRELRFLITLQHPNIVTCWACEYWMKHRYLVTDYCEGGTLRQWMDSRVSLGTVSGAKHILTALSMIEGILSGLSQAHEQNIIHCDIKPENILLEIRSDGVLPRIADFGIARLIQELNQPSPTSSGMSGSPAYMAPERFFGQHSISADLYAVGILLYELLMGDRPFSGTPGALRSAHLNKIVLIPEELPNSLKMILLRALAKLPGQRYRTANEMRLAIVEVIQELQQQPPELLQFTLPQPIDRQVPTLILKRCSHQSVQHPIHQLLLQPAVDQGKPVLYRIESTKVRYGRFDPEAIDRCGTQLHRLSDPIEQAWGSKSACYIATTTELYYCDEDWLKPCLEDPDTDRMAIDVMGNWFVQSKNGKVQLFYPEQKSPRWERMIGGHQSQICHMMGIDSRHFVLLRSSTVSNGKMLQIEVWNRRGTKIGETTLPIAIEKLWSIQHPHHLITTERHSPQSLILIQVQPLQVRRIELPFEPKVIAVFNDGYVAIDIQGNGLVLNREGEGMARLKLPSNPTAATVVDDRYLLVATWATGMGDLSVFDLEPLGALL